MFGKKNDPLTDSIRAVMEKTIKNRATEQEVLKEMGYFSRNQMPREVQPKYDALLAEAKKNK